MKARSNYVKTAGNLSQTTTGAKTFGERGKVKEARLPLLIRPSFYCDECNRQILCGADNPNNYTKHVTGHWPNNLCINSNQPIPAVYLER